MAFWDSVRDTVGAIAPTIGMALGGPLGGLAGQALASVLGVDPNDENALKKAVIGMTPEQAVELKQAELDFQKRMAELEIDLEKISSEDRNSARQREINVKDSMPAILASGITIGYFAVLGWMLVHGVPKDESGGVLMMMFGSLSTAWGGCISYYFGTTRSSAVKNQIIASKL